MVLLAVAVLRAVGPDIPSVVPNNISPAQQAVSGVLAGMADTDLEFLWQYDSLKVSSMEVIRGKYDAGTFTPPDWFIENMEGLSGTDDIPKAREVFRASSKRLYNRQSGPDYDFGRETVRVTLNPLEPKPEGLCGDCNGTGKVGDGRVFTECLNCGGDGKIDDSDRKEEVPFVETSTTESAGDQISRGSVCDNTGFNRDGPRQRVVFPVIKRLLGR
jgi:hypothetical protein